MLNQRSGDVGNSKTICPCDDYEIPGKIIFNWEKSTGHREKSIEHAGNSIHGKKSQFILRRGKWCHICLTHF